MPQAEFSAIATSVDELVALRTQATAKLRGSRKRVRHQKSGLSSSAMLGRGLDFAEVRAYQPGDDVRNMDWNVTARTGIAHTKLFVEERELPCFLMVDMRSSMWFATRGSFKAMQAARLAALLGWCAVAANDRVGGIVFGDNWHFEVKPRSGRAGMMQLIRYMAAAENQNLPDQIAKQSPTRSDTQPAVEKGQATEVAQAAIQASNPAAVLQQNLQRLQQLARRGGDLYVLSDFTGALQAANDASGSTQLAQPEDTPISDLLRAIAHRSHLTLLRIHDPLEADLPAPGQYMVQSRGRRRVLDTLMPNRRERHAARFNARTTLLSKAAGARHVLPVSTQDWPADVLESLLKGNVAANPAGVAVVVDQVADEVSASR